jgi:SAM-dependent methyltransferase
VTTEIAGRSVTPLMERYSTADLAVLSAEEASRYLQDDVDPKGNPALAWELLYRLEPDLYERLIAAERLHPAILEWLPPHVQRVVEVGAGTGRLTLELVGRSTELTAIEPAASLRDRLRRKLPPDAQHVRIIDGFFDALPLPDRSAELVVACSALTAEPAHGGDRGLAEMERVCSPGGMVVIVWPNHVPWLAQHGYRYRSFAGAMTLDFTSLDEAVELARIFYPGAVPHVQARGERRVPYEVVGVNPPRDLAYKVVR